MRHKYYNFWLSEVVIIILTLSFLSVTCLDCPASAYERNYWNECLKAGQQSQDKFISYVKGLTIEEILKLGEQAAVDAMEKGNERVENFPLAMGYILGGYFDGLEGTLTDKVRLAFIEVIQDKNKTWLWRKTIMDWSYPPIAGKNVSKEEAEASTISSNTWLKLLNACQTIMEDKQDDVRIRIKAIDLIGDLYGCKDRVFTDESIYHESWKRSYKSARDIYNDNDDDIRIRKEANGIIGGAIRLDYSRLQENKSLIVFSNKNEVISKLNQDIDKQVNLLKDPHTPYKLRYSALGSTFAYYDLNVSRSSYIKQQTFNTFYEEKQKEDKKFFFELVDAIIYWYKDYSIKSDLHGMLEQNLGRKTKDKIRWIIRDLEIQEKYGD